MNVPGVGATPAAAQPPPVAPVAPVAPSEQAEASGTRPHAGGSGEHGRVPKEKKREEPETPPPPPLRLLTVTEMRVMLGQLPPKAAVEHQHGPEHVRDAYTGE